MLFILPSYSNTMFAQLSALFRPPVEITHDPEFTPLFLGLIIQQLH